MATKAAPSFRVNQESKTRRWAAAVGSQKAHQDDAGDWRGLAHAYHDGGSEQGASRCIKAGESECGPIEGLAIWRFSGSEK